MIWSRGTCLFCSFAGRSLTFLREMAQRDLASSWALPVGLTGAKGPFITRNSHAVSGISASDGRLGMDEEVVMEFYLSEDQQAFQDVARNFAATDLQPFTGMPFCPLRHFVRPQNLVSREFMCVRMWVVRHCRGLMLRSFLRRFQLVARQRPPISPSTIWRAG